MTSSVLTARRTAALMGTVLLVATLTPSTAWSADYRAAVDLTFPVDGRNWYSNDYDTCRSGCSRYHRATDIMVATAGQPVHAAVGGRITWITGIDSAVPSYGYMITIDGDDGRDYSYVHLGWQDRGPLHAYAPGMRKGVRVERGQLIGYAACSGNASCQGPHLHFEIEDLSVQDPYGSNRVNPYESLRAAERRGDLPTAAPTTTAPVRVALTGDWDGDGEAELGWYREGNVSLRRDDGSLQTFSYGRAGDRPITGDWNGDGTDTIGIARGTTWHLRNSNSGGTADISFAYGRSGDIPLPGNWDGNPGDEAGVIRDGTWFLNDSLDGGTAPVSFHYGRVTRGDLPLIGDWLGEGRDRVGIVRDGAWHLRYVYAGGNADQTFTYGRASRGDVPVVGHWGDDDADETPGVVREGAWYLRQENAGGSADAVVKFAAP